MPDTFDIILSHTPRLLQEKMRSEFDPVISPMVEEGEAAILFCDIAGFSKITDKVTSQNSNGIAELVEILDTYIGLMVDIILDHDGDIVKFAGDALFAIWPVSKKNSLENSIAQALQCGLVLKNKANKFAIKNLVIDVRIALAGGPFSAYYVGGIFGRWELLLAGEAMTHVTRAGGLAKAGELVIAKETEALLRHLHLLGLSTSQEFLIQDQRAPLAYQQSTESNKLKSIIERRNKETLHLEVDTEEISVKPTMSDQNQTVQKIEMEVQGDINNTLGQPYSRPDYVRINPACEPALRAYIPRAVLSEIDEKADSRVADYRPVSVIFLKILNLNFKKTYDVYYINEIMQIMQRCLYQYEGSINRFGFDDKGAILLAAFGLPPLVHDDDPRRAVKAALKFRDLFKQHNLECVVGIGTGPVFCGTVGSSRRSEYTMHGTIVNMAAGLMQSASSILCDYTTYNATRQEFEYKAADPVTIKSQKEPIKVYIPLF